MKAWVIGGAVVAAGVAAVVLLPRKPAEVAVVVVAEPEGSRPPLAQTVPVEPAPLPAVVEVTDLSALLDPPAPPADPTPARPGVVAVGFPDWQVGNWTVHPHPQARFADGGRPDPYPPDDHAARLLPPEVAPYPRPAVEVAPMPRPAPEPEVAPLPPELLLLLLPDVWDNHEPTWADEVRPPAGPLLLDLPALARLPVELPFSRNGYCCESFAAVKATAEWEMQANPLAPLWHLTDAHLAAQRSGPADPPPGLPPANPLIGGFRRVFSLAHAADQAPASRTDWYARWHGGDRLPAAASAPAVGGYPDPDPDHPYRVRRPAPGEFGFDPPADLAPPPRAGSAGFYR